MRKSTSETTSTERLRRCALLATAVLAGCADWLPWQGTFRSEASASSPRVPAESLLIPKANASLGDAGMDQDAAQSLLVSQCAADAFAPNDSTESAAQVSTAESHRAGFCEADEVDYFRFAAPVAPGETFSVRVSFSQAEGDIDIALLSAEDEELVASAESITNDEVLSIVSDGGEYILEVTLYELGANASASGVTYRVDFLVAGRATNDCCTQSETPGCSDEPVRTCVCRVDPHCCASDYDAYCTDLAANECGASCVAEGSSGGSQSNCCTESAAGGCSLPAVEACVCEYAAFCCSGPYDNSCAAIAVGLCGAVCEEGSP